MAVLGFRLGVDLSSLLTTVFAVRTDASGRGSSWSTILTVFAQVWVETSSLTTGLATRGVRESTRPGRRRGTKVAGLSPQPRVVTEGALNMKVCRSEVAFVPVTRPSMVVSLGSQRSELR